jgi:hypothetical protein
MHCFMDDSERSHILARFLGEHEGMWSTTCAGARNCVMARGSGKCRCELRFEYLLNVSAQGGDLTRTERLDLKRPTMPLSFFWYARINSAIRGLDQELGVGDQCASLYCHTALTGRLACHCCKSLLHPVWERRAARHIRTRYYCTICIVNAHKQIKHDSTTIRAYKDLVQNNVDRACEMDHGKFIHVVEVSHRCNYGLVLTSRAVNNKLSCTCCDPSWSGWRCFSCGAKH